MLLAAFVAPGLLATPAWVALARRVGKQPLLLGAQATFAVTALALAIGQPLGLPGLVAVVAVLGTAFAAMQVLPFSMLPDVIRAGGPDGTTRAGTYTGVWTATEATGAALGPYLYAGCLGLAGFLASEAGQAVIQPDSALTMVRVAFGVVPAVLMGLALVSQLGYRLDGRLRTGAAA